VRVAYGTDAFPHGPLMQCTRGAAFQGCWFHLQGCPLGMRLEQLKYPASPIATRTSAGHMGVLAGWRSRDPSRPTDGISGIDARAALKRCAIPCRATIACGERRARGIVIAMNEHQSQCTNRLPRFGSIAWSSVKGLSQCADWPRPIRETFVVHTRPAHVNKTWAASVHSPPGQTTHVLTDVLRSDRNLDALSCTCVDGLVSRLFQEKLITWL